MEKRELTCIGCPLGCSVTVTLDNNEIVSVTGYSCEKGNIYARNEVTKPVRVVTSTIRCDIEGKEFFLPVKTKEAIPKEKIFECMKEINSCILNHTVNIGDTVIENVAETGIPVVAAKSIVC